MAIVDNEGRLFGRINLLDAILAILLLGLLPLGYGAYALFRTPAPRLTSVEPAVVTEGPNLRVIVRGENLRPYLRVSFGVNQGLNFLFQDDTRAEVELNPMGPGVYDVVLYDFSQERSRLPKALTIAPSPLPNAQIIVAGSFTTLTPDQRPQVVEGLEIPGVGTVIKIGKPSSASTRVFAGYGTVDVPETGAVRVPATLQINCYVRTPGGRPECVGAGFVLQPTAVLTLDIPKFGKVLFQVDQVRGTEPLEPVTVTARFSGPSPVVAAIKAGDIDLGSAANELAAGAKVLSVSGIRPIGGGGEREVTLAIQSQRTSVGWVYGPGVLRIGGPIQLSTREYEVSGMVLDIKAPAVEKR